MFCVSVGKKERYDYAYRMAALLGLALGFFVLFVNHAHPIAAQAYPTAEISSQLLAESQEDVLASPIPTAIAIQIEPTGSPTVTLDVVTEVPTSTTGVEATESTEGFNLPIILLVIPIGLLSLAIVLILLRWQLRKAPPQASKRAKSNAPPAATHQPVEWNLDEPTSSLPATLPERPPMVPYLESLDHSKEIIYFALTQPVNRVGRGEENELRIDNSFVGWQTVSCHHAQIERHGQDSILIDGGSSNGTQVDGRHSKTNLLQNDCIISFGLVKFAFRNQATTSHDQNPKSKI